MENDLIREFMYGHCITFAIALNKLNNKFEFGIVCDRKDGDEEFIHAFCYYNGKFIDAEGVFTQTNFLNKFFDINPILNKVSKKELLNYAGSILDNGNEVEEIDKDMFKNAINLINNNKSKYNIVVSEAISLIETISGKKVYLKEVGVSEKSSFYDFDFWQQRIKRLKLENEYKGYDILRYKQRGKDIYFIADEDEIFLISEVIKIDPYYMVETIELKNTFKGKGLGTILHEYLIEEFGGVYSGDKQTKGGNLIWVNLLKKGYQIYSTNYKDVEIKINDLNGLYEYFDSDSPTVLIARK